MDILPDAALHRILEFLGDPIQFLHCERSCKAFYKILQDDKVWRACFHATGGMEMPNSQFRLTASFQSCIKSCEFWYRRTDPVILTVLSVVQWKDLAREALQVGCTRRLNFVPFDILTYNSFRLRGDTSAVLMAIVEEFMVDHLIRSFNRILETDYSATVGELNNTYFTTNFKKRLRRPLAPLSKGDLFEDLEANRTTFGFGLLFQFDKNRRYIRDVFHDNPSIKGLVSKTDRDSIIRRLAYKARIPRIDNDVYDAIWTTMVILIFQLMKPGAVDMACGDPEKHQPTRVLSVGETIRNSPPPPVRVEGENEAQTKLLHTIVPAQIEEAAKGLGINWKVYGNEWHIESLVPASAYASGSGKKRAREEALAEEITSELYCHPDGSKLSVGEEGVAYYDAIGLPNKRVRTDRGYDDHIIFAYDDDKSESSEEDEWESNGLESTGTAYQKVRIKEGWDDVKGKWVGKDSEFFEDDISLGEYRSDNFVANFDGLLI